jgi:sulfonate transport system substrate-binding protein
MRCKMVPMREAGRGWIMVLGVALLVGCAGDAGTSSTTARSNAEATTSAATLSPSATITDPATTVAASEPTITATATPAVPAVPAGTTLRIADQYGLFQGIMSLSAEDQDIPYEVEYVTLSPGPPQLQAFQAGEVDLGVVSPLGLIQAASGGVDVRAVARWRTDFALFGVVTAPGVEGITNWADLRGKRVAFQRNAMSEALLMLNLDRLGMSIDDITVVDVPHHLVGTALQGGDADVGLSSEPFISSYLEATPGAAYAFGIEEPLAQSTLIVASGDTLSDPALSAAATEFLTRLDRAFTTLTSDRERFTDLAVDVWHLDRTYVERVLDGSNGVHVEGVPGELLEPYDQLVGLLAGAGLITDDLDAAALFDSRFDGLFTG